MKIKILTINNQNVTIFNTQLNKEILETVFEEDKVLKDEKGNNVFAVTYGEIPSAGAYGLVIPNNEFMLYEDDKTVDELKLKYAKILEKCNKLEDQVLASYYKLNRVQKQIEVIDHVEGEEE